MSSLDVQTIENVATVKSNSSAPPAFQNSSGTEIGELCRAWVCADTTTTPITVTGAFNVSSITDNGTGDITVNYTAPFEDTGYAVVSDGFISSTASWSYGYTTKTTSTSRFRFVTFTGGSAVLTDTASFSVVAFR